MAGEWRCRDDQLSQDDRRMMAEIMKARAADPDGPAPTKAAIIRAGVRLVHARECEVKQ